MLLFNLLNAGYNDNKHTLTRLLNDSVYSANFEETNKSLVIHTGLSFLIQNFKELEILYDIATNTIIRQPRNQGKGVSLPKINGLHVTKMNKLSSKSSDLEYFNNALNLIIYNFQLKDELLFNMLIIEKNFLQNIFDKTTFKDINGRDYNTKTQLTIKNIKFTYFNDKVRKTEKFPFNKVLKERIYYFGDHFNLGQEDFNSDYYR